MSKRVRTESQKAESRAALQAVKNIGGDWWLLLAALTLSVFIIFIAAFMNLWAILWSPVFIIGWVIVASVIGKKIKDDGIYDYEKQNQAQDDGLQE